MNTLLWLTSCESSQAPRTLNFKACILHFMKIIEVVSWLISLSLCYILLTCWGYCVFRCLFALITSVSLLFRCVTCEPVNPLRLPLQCILWSVSVQTVGDGQDKHFVFWTWPWQALPGTLAEGMHCGEFILMRASFVCHSPFAILLSV